MPLISCGLWRKLRHSRGHGVHSPFVYNLITQVIEERSAYYCYDDIERLRLRVLQDDSPLIYGGRQATISRIARRMAISPKKGALLFRLANYFKPRNVLQIGPTVGLSTLYLTSYAPDVTCASLEPVAELAGIAGWVYNRAARGAVDQYIGPCETLLSEVLDEAESPDMIFFTAASEQSDTFSLFKRCLPYTSEDSVFIIDGIRADRPGQKAWEKIIGLSEVTVSIDLYSMGIVFLNRKLHKRNYKVYF